MSALAAGVGVAGPFAAIIESDGRRDQFEEAVVAVPGADKNLVETGLVLGFDA